MFALLPFFFFWNKKSWESYNFNLGCCEVAFALQNVRPPNAEHVLDHDHGLYSFRGRCCCASRTSHYYYVYILLTLLNFFLIIILYNTILILDVVVWYFLLPASMTVKKKCFPGEQKMSEWIRPEGWHKKKGWKRKKVAKEKNRQQRVFS